MVIKFARVSKLVPLLAALAWMAAAPAAEPARAAVRPNSLFIISDDIGLDVSTGMYPGLVDDMAKRHGPSGLNHPQHARIKGHPVSTPNLDRLAR